MVEENFLFLFLKLWILDLEHPHVDLICRTGVSLDCRLWHTIITLKADSYRNSLFTCTCRVKNTLPMNFCLATYWCFFLCQVSLTKVLCYTSVPWMCIQQPCGVIDWPDFLNIQSSAYDTLQRFLWTFPACISLIFAFIMIICFVIIWCAWMKPRCLQALNKVFGHL